MTTGPEFAININHQDARQGANALGSIENLLKNIDARLAQIVAKSGSVNRTMQVTRNTFVQNNTAITQINNTLNQTTNALHGASRGTENWNRGLRAVNRTVGRLLIGMSRLSARASSLAASGFGAAGARGSQAFGGVFRGGGISGIAGSLIRAPFAVGEAGARIGGDLAQSIVGGFGRTLSGIGGALGGLGALGGPAGAIVGGAASLGFSGVGAVTGIGGAILGALGQSAGAVLGAVGEFGGQIAEALTRTLSKGLVVGAGISAFSLFKAAEFQDLEQGFKTLLGPTEDYESALKRLDDAAAGTVSRIGLLKSANLALSLGVAKSSEEIATLVETSRLLGRRLGLNPERAFDRLTVGLARGSLKVLDDLGANPNREKAYRDYAASLGVAVSELTSLEKQAAFSAEAMREFKRLVDLAKVSSDGLAQESRRLSDLFDNVKASAVDIAIEFGNALTPAAFELGDGLADLFRRGEDWLRLHKSDIATATVDFLKALPGYYRDAKEAIADLTVSFAKFLGLSDETISAGASALDTSKGFTGLGERLKTFGSSFVTDVREGLADALSDENIAAAGKKVGGWIAEGFKEAFSFTKDEAVKLAKEEGPGLLKSGVNQSIVRSIFGPILGPIFSRGNGDLITDPGELSRNLTTPVSTSDLLLGNFGGSGGGGSGGSGGSGGGYSSFRWSTSASTGRVSGGRPGPSPFNPPSLYGPPTLDGASGAVDGLFLRSRAELRNLIAATGVEPQNGLLDFVEQRQRTAAGSKLLLNDGDISRLIERAVKDYAQGLRDSARDLGADLRESLGIERGLGRDLERVGEVLKEGSDGIASALAAVPEAVVAINARFTAESAKLAAERDAALKAAPGEALNGIRGEVNLPGLNLRARNALIKDQRLRERRRADEINALFRSKAPQDVFGNVAGVTSGGFAGFGRGFNGDFGDGLGALSGSDTAQSFENDLLALVSEGVEVARISAEIRKQAATEQAKLEAERNAALKEEQEATKRALAEHAALLGDAVILHRTTKEDIEQIRARNARIDQDLQTIKRQIRSLK